LETGKLDHRFLAFYINHKYGAESARSALLREAASAGRLVLCCDNIIESEKDGSDILQWLLYMSVQRVDKQQRKSTNAPKRRRSQQRRPDPNEVRSSVDRQDEITTWFCSSFHRRPG
jgi:hypothetical protein